jgi:hypothetical protein
MRDPHPAALLRRARWVRHDGRHRQHASALGCECPARDARVRSTARRAGVVCVGSRAATPEGLTELSNTRWFWRSLGALAPREQVFLLTHEMQSTSVGARHARRRLTWAASLFVVLLSPICSHAQQDTTKHPMPGMPGMQMPKSPAVKAKIPVTRKRKSSGKRAAKPVPPPAQPKAAAKPMPAMSDSAMHQMPGMKDTSHAAMPGMERRPRPIRPRTRCGT